MNGFYGGNDDSDNFGVIFYIFICYGGVNIGVGNEINGFIFGGVGFVIIINNVEVVVNQDDGIEWFGGIVDVNNVVVWNVGDDVIDIDQFWGGMFDNFFVVMFIGSCFELDGFEGFYVVCQIIKNGIVVVGIFELNEDDELEFVIGVIGLLIDIDENMLFDMFNVYFVGLFVDGQDVMDDELQNIIFMDIIFDIDFVNFVDLMEKGEVFVGIFVGGVFVVDKFGFGWIWVFIRGGLDGF